MFILAFAAIIATGKMNAADQAKAALKTAKKKAAHP